MQETQVWYLGQEDPLEEGMATHSRTFAQRIPWTEEPGGLHSVRKSRTQLKRLSRAQHKKELVYIWKKIYKEEPRPGQRGSQGTGKTSHADGSRDSPPAEKGAQ